jgi:hypothetical protein
LRHVGFFPELEDELCAFSTTGYTGESSPNRGDAYVWAASQLFPQMVKIDTGGFKVPKAYVAVPSAGGWMAG